MRRPRLRGHFAHKSAQDSDEHKLTTYLNQEEMKIENIVKHKHSQLFLLTEQSTIPI